MRIVQVYYGDDQPWDDHQRHHATTATTPGKSDQPIAALLKDLKARGLLRRHPGRLGRRVRPDPDVARGPRAATTTASASRCGWPAAASRGAYVHGATDEFGFTPIEDRIHVHDLHATILHLMGIDHERLTYRYSGRDFRLTDVSGRVVREIMA